MTTFAIVFGMLPVALGRGDGSASRAALAIAVVGGQALCLVVTLVITPGRLLASSTTSAAGRAGSGAWRPGLAARARPSAGGSRRALNGRRQA